MTDRWTVRMVVVVLGLVALATVLGGIWLTSVDREVPDALVAIGGGAAGAIAALLARTSTSAPPGDGG